ncbi:Na(+)/H(+) antiporter subunit D [compost metagenome]
MNNLLVFPLIIPLLTAVVLIFSHRNIMMQRLISVLGSILTIAASVIIVFQVRFEGIQTLFMGGWEPPYGIVFVADMFAALLVLTTSVIGSACIIFAFRSIGEEREKHYFYAFVQFLIAGVHGSFLTGDLFNLFVCFEVMLIASYALIVLGGTRLQLKETLKYILINIISSTLFVAAVAYLYSITGTLNMAHLSSRIVEVGQGGIITVVAVLFLIVFALKAGLFLFFWLPGSYTAPPTVVKALFGALLTKVGLYAIIRTFTLIFYHQPDVTHHLIGWMSIATILLGGFGSIAYSDVNKIINYNVLIGVGFIGIGIAAATQDSLNGIVYYLIHDMLAKALLYLLGGMLVVAAGTSDFKQMGGLIHRHPRLGWMFFITVMALVGVPPLSGFPGKLLILQGSFKAGEYLYAAVGILSSLFVLYSLVRLFIGAFFGEETSVQKVAPIRGMLPAAGLLVLIIIIGICSEWLLPYISQAGDVLVNSDLYIESVLKE